MENNSIGLWEKTSQKGNKYYSGKAEINGKQYVINLFKVDKSENSKRPDYNIIIKELKEETKKESSMSDSVFEAFGNNNSISDEDLAF